MLKGAFTSPKIRLLAVKLGVPFPHALGICGMLWNFTANHAPCGDVGRHDDASIAIAVEWPGDPKALVAALVGTRLVDEHPQHRLVIHDWEHHCPHYVRSKVARAGMSLVPASVRPSADTKSGLEPALVASTLTHTPSHTPTLTHTENTSGADVAERNDQHPAVRRRVACSIELDRESGWSGITDADRAVWHDAYPGIDIDGELAKARSWVLADWARRKKTAWRRFLVGWFGRAQDRAVGTMLSAATSQAAPKPERRRW